MIGERAKKAANEFMGMNVTNDSDYNDDNVAIAFCSYFEGSIDCPIDQEVDDETPWKPWATDHYERLEQKLGGIIQKAIGAALKDAGLESS